MDLAAVRADDVLLDAIAGGTASRGDRLGAYGGLGAGGNDDDQLAAVLAAWRADIEAEPMPELVTLDEALEAVDAGHRARDRRSSRMRRRMPFAIAAAAAVVAFVGMGVAVHGALPGDTLWTVSKAAFPSRADGIEKAQEAQVTIDAANAAIRRGDLNTARTLLQTADKKIGVLPPEVQPPLAQQQTEASRSLTPGAPGSTGTRGATTGEAGGTASEPGSAGSSPAPGAPSPAAPAGPDVATTPTPAEPGQDRDLAPAPDPDASTDTSTTTTTPAPPGSSTSSTG